MACCGGGARPQRVVRQQGIAKQTVQSAPVQRKLSAAKTAAEPVGIQRQYVMPREQCVKCGYPGMTVVIAGRERMQCSNVNCKTIIS